MATKIPLKITDTTFRDGHQSILATRMRTADMLDLVRKMRASILVLGPLLARCGRRRARARAARRRQDTPTGARVGSGSGGRMAADTPRRFEHFAHEADIGVRGTGPTLAAALEQAALALTAVITDPEKVACRETVRDSGLRSAYIRPLAAQAGIETQETPISREQLYSAEEIFMTGTAAEVTPVRQVDHITIGNGGCGPLTRQLQDAFFGLFNGQTEDKWGWL